MQHSISVERHGQQSGDMEFGSLSRCPIVYKNWNYLKIFQLLEVPDSALV
jgi:hypothetical protein